MSGDWEDAVITVEGKPLEELLAKGERRPRPIWTKIIEPHFDERVRLKGPFPTLGRARIAVQLLLKDLGKPALDRRTIERHINSYRPGWIKPKLAPLDGR